MTEPTIDNYGHGLEPRSAPINHLVGKGWVPLIVELCEQLDVTEAEANPDWRATQVKEKFGGLRFYTTGLTKEGQALVDRAEARSYKTCEVCGNPGDRSTVGGWDKTVCAEHHEARLERHQYYEKLAKEAQEYEGKR